MDGCISVLVRLFFNQRVSNSFYIQQFLYTGVHFLQFLNAVICSLITLFFKCLKMHQILSQFSTINLALALDINIFERDSPNLNNPIPSKDINLWQIYKVYYREQKQHLMQQKRRTLLALHFKEKYPTQDFFFNLVPKESFAPKCKFSIKFRNQMKLWHRIDLLGDYCEQFFKYHIFQVVHKFLKCQ